ncbi:Cholesterol 7-alpha-monooxygenase [Fusarium oxysporum f. sp. albedinis]|nr:Cholesterol 7-alpha-monooxygenase [Fusarium oxysporum f. sp. albedinis]
MQGDSAVHNRGGLSSKALEIVIGRSFKAHALDTSLIRRVRPGVFLYEWLCQRRYRFVTSSKTREGRSLLALCSVNRRLTTVDSFHSPSPL